MEKQSLKKNKSHSCENQGVHSSPDDINPQISKLTRLKFEFLYYDVNVQ